MMIKLMPILILLFLGGCKSRDPHPEIKDPIYNAFLQELSKAEKTFADADKVYHEALIELDKPQSATQFPKVARQGVYHQALREKEKATQILNYAKSRVSVRQKQVRLNYNDSLDKEHPTASEDASAQLKDLDAFRKARDVPRSYGQAHEKRLKEFQSSRVPANATKTAEAPAKSEH